MENIDIEIKKKMELMSESEKIRIREIIDEIDRTTAKNKLLNDLRIRVEQEIEKKGNFDNNHKIFTDKSTQTS